jgi:hypothetical protein
MMREREVFRSLVDADATEYPLFEVPALIRIKIKAGLSALVPFEQ